MSSAEFREAPRALLYELADCRHNDSWMVVCLKDLSESGAQIEYVGSLLESGDIVELCWKVVPGTEALRMEAQIIWARGNFAGLRFIDLSPRTLYVLRALIRIHRL